jgi:cephalosporin hydroxylase
MIVIDMENGSVSDESEGKSETFPIGSPQAFELLSKIWLRSGWDAKYVYGFSWLGRPIIQLPEDMIRIQEVIYRVKPDFIIETGIAHGGSLIFYASICKALGYGRIIGIDIEIRPPNRKAIEEHELFPYITLIEGDSTSPAVINQVRSIITPNEKVLIMLDSNHTKKHVLSELNAYSPLVSIDSYIIASDGIMKDLAGAPRSNPDWADNNPFYAAQVFQKSHPEFAIETPLWPFNETNSLTENVTYWPGAWLKRLW